MNTLEIFKILNSNRSTKNNFLGVYPIDMLPEIVKYPASLVVNLDTSSQPGSHWVALYFNHEGVCEFFDSYGRKPVSFVPYFNQNATRYIYNNEQVQDFSTISCGHMCIYFLILRARGYSFKDIIQSMQQSDIYKYFLKADK